MGLGQFIANVGRAGGDVLQLCYPSICAACDAPARPRAFLCPACDGQLSDLTAAGRCVACAMPLSVDGSPCPWCEGHGVSHYDAIARLGTLSDPLKHLVHRIKYNGKWPIAERLTDALLASGRADAVLRDTDVLVPIPLHWYRHMHRGYNQAEVIAARLASGWRARSGGVRITVASPIVRLVPTETQTHVHGRARREENLKNAFGLVRPQDVEGRRVTVVDDVTTTGATLLSFARTLKAAHPAKLHAITLAIADPDGR